MTLRFCVAVLLLMPPAAFAQGNQGPFGGLFGRTPERSGGEYTALDFRNAVGVQHGEASVRDGVLDDVLLTNGTSAGGNASLVFERQSDRFRMTTHGNVAYQESLKPTLGATSYNAGMVLRGQVTNRLQVDASAQYQRSPFFQFVPVSAGISDGAPVAVPGEPFAARLLTNDSRDVSAGFTSQYTKRSSLTASVSQRSTRFHRDEVTAFNVLGAHAMWRRSVTRDVAVHAGYTRERILQGAPGAEFTHETIDVGADFLKQLSIGRRTTLSITTQTSMVKRPQTDRHYRLNGELTVSRRFRRTWQVSAGAARSTEFYAGLVEPVLQDGVRASVGGMLGTRAEWTGFLSAGRGEFGFDTDGKFVNGQAATRLSWGLAKHLGVYSQYAYYYHQVPRNAAAVLLLQQLSRHSYSVGITTWVPIFEKVRAPRDPE